jgi:hypothetical protein
MRVLGGFENCYQPNLQKIEGREGKKQSEMRTENQESR